MIPSQPVAHSYIAVDQHQRKLTHQRLKDANDAFSPSKSLVTGGRCEYQNQLRQREVLAPYERGMSES
jgi:hypothetical protein